MHPSQGCLQTICQRSCSFKSEHIPRLRRTAQRLVDISRPCSIHIAKCYDVLTESDKIIKVAAPLTTDTDSRYVQLGVCLGTKHKFALREENTRADQG